MPTRSYIDPESEESSSIEINAVGIIPARFASSRLPGKPLADINGKSLIRRVWENVSASNLMKRVIVAVDDEKVLEECRSFGAQALMTPPDLPSGSDRIAYTCRSLNIDADYIVNIQGDEPLLSGEIIDKLLLDFTNSNTDVATLIRQIDSVYDIFEPSIVKVVTSKDGRAIYFSRNPIPFVRDEEPENWLNSAKFYKHIGVYVYRRDVLLKFVRMPQSMLEASEKLEQLRLLENGYKFLCVKTTADLVGVDTPKDLERVRKIILA